MRHTPQITAACNLGKYFELDDRTAMNNQELAVQGGGEWVLAVLAVAKEAPGTVVDKIGEAVVSAGAWVLGKGMVSSQCSEIDIEFPRSHCVEIYSQILSLGVQLTCESHAQIAELWHCTHQLTPACRETAARLHLCLYTREGSESFLKDRLRPVRQAA